MGLILLILWRFTGRTRERFDVPPVCPEGFRMFDQENTLCLREMEHVCPNYAPFGIAGADISERCSNEADGSGMKFAAVCPPGSRLGGEFGDTCYKSATPTCPAGYIKHDPDQNGIQMCKEPTAAAAEAAVEAAEVARARADLPDPPAPADPPAVADPLAQALSMGGGDVVDAVCPDGSTPEIPAGLGGNVVGKCASTGQAIHLGAYVLRKQ